MKSTYKKNMCQHKIMMPEGQRRYSDEKITSAEKLNLAVNLVNSEESCVTISLLCIKKADFTTILEKN